MMTKAMMTNIHECILGILPLSLMQHCHTAVKVRALNSRVQMLALQLDREKTKLFKSHL